jgi:ABC-type phosphate transport system permease subunit
MQSLTEIGLVLFGITIVVNLLAQLLLRTFTAKSDTRAVQ